MKNNIASIQTRLKNVAQQENKTYQIILIRYFIERLMYRLSVSPFQFHFCLKGGALLYALDQEANRPTMDLDLLGLNLSREQTRLKHIFQLLCQIPCEVDGVSFLEDSVITSEIQKEGKYSGIRVKIDARLGNIRHFLQVDIGFGDVITPAPVKMSYPTLLPMPMPQIIAYSVETVIAEKFEAMIDLAAQNSRMKDFYDVYKLLQKKDYQETILEAAIQNTFQRRGTAFAANPVLFTADFKENAQRQLDWKAFLKKMNQPFIDFPTILQPIIQVLKPIYDKQ
jgi:predicted nucleotidyltransferase component of viral defense system